MKSSRLSLPVKILIGLVLGIGTGFFFGEYCSFLEPIGQAFIMLLKMSVLPYITLALMHGLGNLKPLQAKHLVKYGLFFIVLIWVVTIGTIYILAQAYPPRGTASFYPIGSAVPEKMPILELFIPSNIFYSFTNNIVPAVVLFSVFFGVALMLIKEKDHFLHMMETAIGALTKIIKGVVQLSPYGIFALMAGTTGTTTFHQFQKLEAYLIVFVAMTIFLVGWALPMLVGSFTKIGYRQFFRELQSPLLLAFSTGNIFVSLPYIMEALEKLSEHPDPEQALEARNLSKTLAPISYNLPLVGNLMAMAVMVFLAYFYAVEFTLFDDLKLIISSLFTLVGPVAAGYNSISFLIDEMHLPKEGISIFAETWAVTRNLQGLAGAMGIAAFTLLTVFAFTKQMTIRWFKLIMSIVVGVIILVALFFIARWAIPTPEPAPAIFPKLEIVSPVTAKVYNFGDKIPPRAPPQAGRNRLDRIRQTKLLRVGYNPQAMPFAYFNEKGELVGYDIAYAYDLAQTLGVNLEFIPFDYNEIAKDLNDERFDIAMSAIGVNPERLEKMIFATPTTEIEVAFVVPDFKRDLYTNLNFVKSRSGLRIGVLKGTHQLEIAQREFPKAVIIPLDTYEEVLDKVQVDALLWSNQEGLTWAISHPKYTVVVPTPSIHKDFYAYAVKEDSLPLLEFVNYWLRLKQLEGFKEKEHAKWVKGEVPEKPKRWSVIHDVLHWVD